VRLLVTGATGFVGRHLLAALAGRHDVVAVARSQPPDALAALADWVELDLARPLERQRLPGRVDGIVHLAQSYRYRDFPTGAEDVYAVNVHSTFALLEWGRRAGVQAFVLASTGGVYAYAPHALREDDPVAPDGLYFRAKYAAELLVGAYAELMRPVILRPFFVYGEGQRGMMIATLADRVRRGEEIVVDGDPGLRVNPVHVDDAVRVVEPALIRPVSGVINVAGPDELSVSALVDLLGVASGVAPVLRHNASKRDGDLVASTDRMRRELAVTPAIGIEEGVRRLAAARLRT
jgi:nucleoside-diphosphate-sugar epimerase